MPEFSIHRDENKIKDIGIIENGVYTFLTMQQHKDHSVLFHVLYALISAVLGYLVVDGQSRGVPAMLCTVAMFAFPALYAYTLLYSPMVLKILVCLLPMAALGLRILLLPFATDTFLNIAMSFIGYFMCLLASAVMYRTAIWKNTKLWCFTAITVCCGLCFMAASAVLLLYSFGTVDVGVLIDKLNGAIDTYSGKFSLVLTSEFANSETFDVFKAAIPELSAKTPAQAAQYFGEALKNILYTLKSLIPAIFALVCMFFGFVFTAAYSLVAKIHKIPLFVCIMDNNWCYRVPPSCITFFDIVLLLVIISSLFGLPSNISASVINLLLILMPVILTGTFKAIHFFLGAKLKSKAAATVICIIIAILPLMIMGLWGYLLLCSIGVTLIWRRYRIESVALKDKIIHDTNNMMVLCGCETIEEFYNLSKNSQNTGEDSQTFPVNEAEAETDECNDEDSDSKKL